MALSPSTKLFLKQILSFDQIYGQPLQRQKVEHLQDNLNCMRCEMVNISLSVIKMHIHMYKKSVINF